MVKTKNVTKCSCEDDIPSLQEQLEGIMKNFDFLHVQQMMNWEKALVDHDDDGNHTDYHQWRVMLEKDFKIPTVEELKQMAYRHLKSAIAFAERNPRNKFYMTGSGPFMVMFRYGILQLVCDFESWSCD